MLFTPWTTVISAPEHGAETMTLLAPLSTCNIALSLDAKTPVHSKIISTFLSLHFKSIGLLSDVTVTLFSSIENCSFEILLISLERGP